MKEAQGKFKTAVVKQSITVDAGYLTKPESVEPLIVNGEIFLHVSSTHDWVCRAVTSQGRSGSPLKMCVKFFQSLAQASRRSFGSASALAEGLSGEIDPMGEITGVCDGGASKDDGEVETPKKRSRRRLSPAEQDFLAVVPLGEIGVDCQLFDAGSERERVRNGRLRVVIKTNRRAKVHVHEKDLDLLLLVLRRLVERMGVPLSNLPREDLALAGQKEWFVTRTSQWSLRVLDTDQVITSSPVRRKDNLGNWLRPDQWEQAKAAALAALKSGLESRQERASCEIPKTDVLVGGLPGMKV